MTARRFNTRDKGFDEAFAAFLTEPRGAPEDVAESVREILNDVRAHGGAAVAEYTAKFDRLTLDPTLLTSDNVDLTVLSAGCPQDLRDAIDFAADRIAAYHEAQKPSDHRFSDEAGVELGWRWTPLDSVGVYVPGGLASYPSSVLMNVIPAKIAGVERIVMTAPAPGGQLSNAVAYAALKAGVDEFYPIGGAQAVGALAFGAGRLTRVDKVVGPGNAYVAEAKRQVFGHIGIDTIAGPSEICVIAEPDQEAAWVAADLLSQAEHDSSSQSILITTDEAFADAVGAEIKHQLGALTTEARARESWSGHGALVVAGDLAEAIDVANRIAPEHLLLAVADPEAQLPAIKHAGAVFLGSWTPEALGDYVTGSNHVLPTSQAARFSSGLGLTDFMKRMSIQKAGPEGFNALAAAALRLAEAEGLPAHGRSISIRMGERGGDG
ncbi:MAG: histidinol dehydrogenase [Pseudomonadota bacterium]